MWLKVKTLTVNNRIWTTLQPPKTCKVIKHSLAIECRIQMQTWNMWSNNTERRAKSPARQINKTTSLRDSILINCLLQHRIDLRVRPLQKSNRTLITLWGRSCRCKLCIWTTSCRFLRETFPTTIKFKWIRRERISLSQFPSLTSPLRLVVNKSSRISLG